MLKPIQQIHCQTEIRAVAGEVRAYLSGVVALCVGRNAEDFVTKLILATNNRTGQPLSSWLLSPECLLDGAGEEFRAAFPQAVTQLSRPGEKLSPFEASNLNLPLREMIHARMQGLSDQQSREFLRQAFRSHTDVSSLYNVLRYAPRDYQELFGNLCSRYRLRWESYSRLVCDSAREAVDVRNTYLGHDNLSVFQKMTPELLADALTKLIAPAEVLADAGNAEIEKMRARRDRAVAALRCQPLTLKELEQAVPDFDIFMLNNSQLKPDFDVGAGILYLHSPQEVCDVLGAIRRHFDNTSSNMRRQEERLGAIQEMQAEMQSSLSALTRMVQTAGVFAAPAAAAPVSSAPAEPDAAAAPAAPAAPVAALPPLPRMLEYRQGRLTEPQLAEVVTNCNVLADASCWLSREGQRFLTERVLPLQSGSKKRVIVDWATRVDLYRMELDTQNTPEQRARAHEARIVMSHLHRQGKINYAPERAGLHSSQSSLVDVVLRNPGQRICLLTVDWDFCRVLAGKDLPNAMPLMVGTNLGCMVHPVLRPMVLRNSQGTAEGTAATSAVTAAAVEVPAKPAEPRAEEPEVICETGACLPWTRPAEGMVLRTEQGKEVTLVAKLAEGGEGEIYTTGDNALVAKIYNKRHLTANRRDKLRLMLEKTPKVAGLCWPTALLYHADDSFAGFLMPRIDPAYRELTTSVLQLGKPSVQQKLPGWDRLALVRTCLKLCSMLDRLHRAGILMGDINPRNILVRTADPEHPMLAVVDCDSCQIGSYPCPVGTVLHTSPAIYKRLNTSHPRYGTFLRTPEDENYAMAVLLFELLMLNQSPFSSKGVTDLAQAVREGKFAYRFAPKDSNEVASDGSDTPDGPYRMIWGNMPYAIREGFYNTFARAMPPTPVHWRNALQNYEHDILSGSYTRELTPTRYFDWDGTHTTDFTCEECGAQANMPRERWENNQRFNRLNLCNNCYSAMMRLLNDPELVPVHCIDCGREFKSNKWQATLESRDMANRGRIQDRLCPECRQSVKVTCASCGKEFHMTRSKWKRISLRGNRPLCRDCFPARN